MQVTLPHFDGRAHRGFGREGQHDIDLAAQAIVVQKDLAAALVVVLQGVGVAGQRIVDVQMRHVLDEQLFDPSAILLIVQLGAAV